MTLSFNGLKYNFQDVRPQINKPTTYSYSAGTPNCTKIGSFVTMAIIRKAVAREAMPRTMSSLCLLIWPNIKYTIRATAIRAQNIIVKIIMLL